MNSIVIFEIDQPAKINQIKTGLYALGYMNSWQVSDADTTRYYLPSQAVWKVGVTLDQAFNEVNTYVISQGCSLVRCMVVPSAPWHGIAGNPV